jgi:ATP-dependent DNA ligase
LTAVGYGSAYVATAFALRSFELLSRAFAEPYELSPVIEPSIAVALDMAEGRLEGLVLKDRHGTYRDGSRRGWSKVKDPSWHEREAWRFDRRAVSS